MNELLSWALVVGAILAFVGFGFAVLQIVSSADEFWLSRGFFICAALVAVGRIILWGITTQRSLTLRVAVCFIVCGAALTLAVEAVRYVNRKHDLWVKSHGVTSEPLKALEDEEGEANLVCEYTRTADVGFIHGYCSETTPPKNARVALVAFGNKDAKASMQNYVKARITFRDSNGKHIRQINNGVWLEEETTSIQYFDVGEVRELAVALMPHNIQQVYAFDNDATWDITTAAQELNVEVILRGGIISTMLGTFNFKLTLQPEFGIEEIKTAQEKVA